MATMSKPSAKPFAKPLAATSKPSAKPPSKLGAIGKRYWVGGFRISGKSKSLPHCPSDNKRPENFDTDNPGELLERILRELIARVDENDLQALRLGLQHNL